MYAVSSSERLKVLYHLYETGAAFGGWAAISAFSTLYSVISSSQFMKFLFFLVLDCYSTPFFHSTDFLLLLNI